MDHGTAVQRVGAGVMNGQIAIFKNFLVRTEMCGHRNSESKIVLIHYTTSNRGLKLWSSYEYFFYE